MPWEPLGQRVLYFLFYLVNLNCREISTGFRGAHLIFSCMGDEHNDPSGCWAYVGCQGAQGGKTGQTINLGSSGCFNMGTILHEIMHSLGE